MRKAELIAQVALATGYDKKTVTVITEGLMKGIKNSMSKGEEWKSFFTSSTDKRL